MSLMRTLLGAVLCSLQFGVAVNALAQPAEVSYQGQLMSNGSKFSGPASMKFAIVSGTTTLWSNDGTSVNGGQPTSAVTVPVADGLFNVRLGAAPMVPLTAAALNNATSAALRMWVSTGGSFEQLSDQPISSSAFALRSASAGTVGGWVEEGANVYRTGGNVGIGTAAPEAALDVRGKVHVGRGSASSDGDILLLLNSTREWEFRQRGSGPSTALELRSVGGGGNKNFYITTDGAVVVQAASGGGTLRTGVLEITGADIVESFDTTDGASEPGTVLVIDELNAGQLKACTRPYDCRVAGVVSGAGALPAGIVMGRGSAVDGSTPVAMTGRVYVKCTIENGPIRPGDLLTTSSTQGMAMRASDPVLRAGAVLGKAMTSLEEGRGLVLVLVSLQ